MQLHLQYVRMHIQAYANWPVILLVTIHGSDPGTDLIVMMSTDGMGNIPRGTMYLLLLQREGGGGLHISSMFMSGINVCGFGWGSTHIMLLPMFMILTIT